MKAIGVFVHDKAINGSGGQVACYVRVFPLLVKRQSKTWPEIEQRDIQWVAPERALALIKDPALNELVSTFVKRIAVAASKINP